MVWRHKSTEGIGLEEVFGNDRSIDEIDETTKADRLVMQSEFDDEFDSKTVKIALGGIAAGGLLVGIYALAHHRLNKKKEQ